MSNKGRVITLVAKIIDDEYPKWIFENHQGKDRSQGIHIFCIAEGDLNSELEAAYKEIEHRDLGYEE